MVDNKNTKNYQKVKSRTTNNKKTQQKTISEQAIRYLVMNPLAVNYSLHQETYIIGNGTINATQQYTN